MVLLNLQKHQTIEDILLTLTIMSANDHYLILTKIGSMSGEDMAKIFSAIPEQVEHLVLIGNKLGALSTEDLVLAFTAIAPHIKYINLSYNYLGNKSGEALVRIFSVLRHVTHLDLGNNNFFLNKPEELVQVFSALPPTLIFLGIGENCFININTGSKLGQIFAAFPVQLKQLDLRLDWIGMHSNTNELTQAFAALPSAVTEVNLYKNDFEFKEDRELIAIFAAFPKGVNRLVLSPREIFRKKSIFSTTPYRSNRTLIKLGKSLPWVVTIQFEHDSKKEYTAQINLINKHIGAGVVITYVQLKLVAAGALPSELVYLILEYMVDARPAEIEALLHHRNSIEPRPGWF